LGTLVVDVVVDFDLAALVDSEEGVFVVVFAMKMRSGMSLMSG